MRRVWYSLAVIAAIVVVLAVYVYLTSMAGTNLPPAQP